MIFWYASTRSAIYNAVSDRKEHRIKSYTQRYPLSSLSQLVRLLLRKTLLVATVAALTHGVYPALDQPNGGEPRLVEDVILRAGLIPDPKGARCESIDNLYSVSATRQRRECTQ